MKRLFIIFVMLLGSLEAFSQAATLLPVQANNLSGIMPPNLLWVDPVTYRIWPVKSDSLKMGYPSIRWLNDSVIVIGDRRWVKLAGSYPNPSFISSLASSKVTGLSTVATTGDYSDLSNKPTIPSTQVNSDWNSSIGVSQILNKPNLSVYETTSHASSTYQPIGSYYPLTGNPSNFLTSFTETDPIYSANIANYRTKTQNDALYKAIGYVPSNAEVISALGYTPYNSTNPNGYISSVPAQSFASLTGKPTTLSGYGITDAYPLSGNPSNFLTTITNGQVTTALGFTPVTNARTLTINGTTFDLSANRTWTVGDVTSAGLSSTLSSYVLTSTYTAGLAAKQNTLSLTSTGSGAATLVGSTLNIPTPTSSVYTAGTGISIASNVITNNAPDLTVVLTGSNGITTSGTYPNFSIQQTTPTYNNAPTRALTTSFRPSTTRPTRVSYTISIATTLSLLNLNSSGTVALQISSDNVSWVTINQAGITRTLAVSISVGLNDTSLINVAGEIPSGWYCRLVPTTSGGATITLSSAQEVTY